MKLSGPPIDVEALIPQWMERLHQYTGWNSRRIVTVALAAGGIIMLSCLFLSSAVLIFVQTPAVPTLTPTRAPLPTSSVTSVLAYLNQQGTIFKTQQDLKVPNVDWHATQGTQFTIQPDKKPSTFLILSYDTIQNAELDAFAVSNNPKWKTWHLVQLVNVLVLGDPANDPDIETTVEKNLTQFLVTSYRAVPTLIPASSG